MDANKLADEIVEYLFVNGIGSKAQRLVLELEDGKDGGGWCKAAVRDVVVRVIQKWMGKKSK